MPPFVDLSITAILITAVVFTCITILGVVIIWYSMRKRRMEIEVYKAAIDKGLSVPEFKLVKSPVGTLKSALVWLAIGVGLFIILLVEAGGDGIAASAIPILIGLALIASYIIEKKEIKEKKPELNQ